MRTDYNINQNFDLTMNKNFAPNRKANAISMLCLSLCLLSVGSLLCLAPCRAALPEPDNIVYGLVWLGTNQVTAQNTNVIIEVRLPGGTNVLSSYRMGRDPALGNYYFVEIRLGYQASLSGAAALTNGSAVEIILQEGGIERARTNFIVGGPTLVERGYVQRIDLGTANVAVTGLAAWLARYGLGADTGNQDSDYDGYSNQQEFLAGTDPTSDSSKFTLRIAVTNNITSVSFVTLQATGTGYENSIRYYALEELTDLKTTNWQTLTELSNVIGSNEPVIYSVSTNRSPSFFRGKVWLGTQ
jgi:hypothetical protein